MTIYKDCSSISVFNFFKIIETQEFRFLIKGYKEGQKLRLGTKKQQQLQQAFKEIVWEYTDLIGNKKLQSNYLLEILITEQEFEYEICSCAIEMFNEFDSIETLDIITEFGYSLDLDKKLEPQVKVALRRLIGLKQKIKINKIKYEKKNKVKENDKKSQIPLLEEKALYFENVLKLGYAIKIKKTNLSKWIQMDKLCKIKIASYATN